MRVSMSLFRNHLQKTFDTHVRVDQQGSILIVVLAVMMLAGIMVTFGIEFLKIQTQEERRIKTVRDMQFIANQISSAAQRLYTMPCPALPSYVANDSLYGRSAYDANPPPNSDCISHEGVLPVRSLGIPDEYMKDAWGRYYTFAINRAFNTFYQPNLSIFQVCRTDRWIKNAGSDYNLNLTKALFCCPQIDDYDPAGDLQVNDVSGISYLRSGDAANYGNANGPPLGPTIPNTQNGETISYVLISHGPDGMGAYVAGQTGNNHNTTGLAGPQLENANNNINFVKAYSNPQPGDDYFDDLVQYQTQYQVMSNLGSGNCMGPYFAY